FPRCPAQAPLTAAPRSLSTRSQTQHIPSGRGNGFSPEPNDSDTPPQEPTKSSAPSRMFDCTGGEGENRMVSNQDRFVRSALQQREAFRRKRGVGSLAPMELFDWQVDILIKK